MDETNNPDDTTLIRIKMKTYYKLERIKQKKKFKNLRETGKVGDADFDSIINDLLKKNGKANYQPEGGEERTTKGGKEDEKTQPTMDKTRGVISDNKL